MVGGDPDSSVRQQLLRVRALLSLFCPPLHALFNRYHTMVSRLSFVLALAAASVASASIVPRGEGSCSTGPIQCCNQVQSVRIFPRLCLRRPF